MTEDLCECDIRETRSRISRIHCRICEKRIRPQNREGASAHSGVLYDNLAAEFDGLRESDIMDDNDPRPGCRTSPVAEDSIESQHYQSLGGLRALRQEVTDIANEVETLTLGSTPDRDRIRDRDIDPNLHRALRFNSERDGSLIRSKTDEGSDSIRAVRTSDISYLGEETKTYPTMA